MMTVQSVIGYTFADTKLLAAAFTHSSFVNEHATVGNERIEFLGDCVLNFLVGEKLFFNDRRASEGALSARRAALVSRMPLARIVDELGFIEYLQVGAGVDKSEFSDKARSDLFEALLGAVYIDGGMDACRTVLDNIYYCNVEPEHDYKTALQEYAASYGLKLVYVTEKTVDGFKSVAAVGNREFYGLGKSKRTSQIAAARTALAALRKD